VRGVEMLICLGGKMKVCNYPGTAFSIHKDYATKQVHNSPKLLT